MFAILFTIVGIMILAGGIMGCLCTFCKHLIHHTKGLYDSLPSLVVAAIGIIMLAAIFIVSSAIDVPVADKVIEETNMAVLSYEESDSGLEVCYTENNRVAYVKVMPDSIRYDAEADSYLEHHKVVGYRKWWEQHLLIPPMEEEWILHLPTT